MAWLKQWDDLFVRRITDASELSGLGTIGLNDAAPGSSPLPLRIRKSVASGGEWIARSLKARLILGMFLSVIAHAVLLFVPWAETPAPVVRAVDTMEVALVDETMPDTVPAEGERPEADDTATDEESSLATDHFALYEPTNLKAVSCDALVGLCGRKGLEPMHSGRLKVHLPSGANIGAGGIGRGCLFSLDQLDMLPHLRRGAKPYYPKSLLDAQIEGTVRLLVLLDTKGRVKVMQILQSDDPGFTDSAVQAAEQFVYAPPTRHGRPVNTEFTLPISFSIE